jgi:ParB-like nuclease domain
LIDTPDNVRDLDADHVNDARRVDPVAGLLLPLVVRASDSRYELVAGFHRFAVVKRLGESVTDSVPLSSATPTRGR